MYIIESRFADEAGRGPSEVRRLQTLIRALKKDGRGNEPLPLRYERCAETPEDS